MWEKPNFLKVSWYYMPIFLKKMLKCKNFGQQYTTLNTTIFSRPAIYNTVYNNFFSASNIQHAIQQSINCCVAFITLLCSVYNIAGYVMSRYHFKRCCHFNTNLWICIWIYCIDTFYSMYMNILHSIIKTGNTYSIHYKKENEC